MTLEGRHARRDELEIDTCVPNMDRADPNAYTGGLKSRIRNKSDL